LSPYIESSKLNNHKGHKKMDRRGIEVKRVGALIQATLVHVGGSQTEAFGVTEKEARDALQEKLVERHNK